MGNNNTPQQIVERWLPNRKELWHNFEKKYEGHGIVPRILKEWFTVKFFAEALAERDRQMCEKQRAACSNSYYDDDDLSYSHAVDEAILNAPMPKMDE